MGNIENKPNPAPSQINITVQKSSTPLPPQKPMPTVIQPTPPSPKK